jgi:cell division protein FtsQ
MKRWIRWTGLGSIPVGLILIGWFGPDVLRAMPLFRVRRVEVHGARYLTAREVAAALRLRSRACVFDHPGPLVWRIEAVDGVTDATVDWRIPGALVVNLTERTPVALSRAAGGRLVLVDRTGRVLPFDPTRAPADFPIAAADSAVTAVLDRIRETEPDLYRRVITAGRDGSTVVLETGARRVLLRIGASSKTIQALALVQAEVDRLGMTAAELDARFEGRVVVRGRRT